MSTILDQILEYKREFVGACKARRPLAEIQSVIENTLIQTRGFKYAIEAHPQQFAVIAEAKRKSPSRGVIVEDFHAGNIAKAYAENGASAISVLTDEKYFGGHLDYLNEVKSSVDLPVLRKDFIIDEYQVYESFASGADAILLIAAALEQESMMYLSQLAQNIGLDVLVEVHAWDELKKINDLENVVIGINNRNLKTMEVDLNTTKELFSEISPEALVITESGVSTRAQVQDMKAMGVRGLLIGEYLLSTGNPGKSLRDLLS